jgi:hypothetical protein
MGGRLKSRKDGHGKKKCGGGIALNVKGSAGGLRAETVRHILPSKKRVAEIPGLDARVALARRERNVPWRKLRSG